MSKKLGRPPRPHRVILKLNDREFNALDEYCRVYGIANRSEWLRQIMMVEIIQRLEQTTPLLFREDEMR